MEGDKESKSNTEERPNCNQICDVNQIECKKNLEIADKFNKFFIESIRSKRDTIPNVQYSNYIPISS